MILLPPELITTLTAQVEGSNLFLFIVLVMLFVIGYRVLQAVIKLAMVSVMSGIYFVALNVFGFGPAITIDRILLFMILGTGLFITYSSIATVMAIAGTLYEFLRDQLSVDTSKIELPKRKKNNSKEKEIILGEVDDDD